jgi:hypothetical protein
MQSLGCVAIGLVEWRVAILILNGDNSAPFHQVSSHRLIAPEAGIMQWGVAMLIDKVHIRLVLQQLLQEKTVYCSL